MNRNQHSGFAVFAAFASGAILLSTALRANAQDAPAAPAVAAASASTTLSDLDKKFAKMAGYGNASEVAGGKLAQQKSKHPDVLHVAEMLVNEHGQALNELTPIGKSVNTMVPDAPDAKHKKMAEKLSKLDEADFNRAFIKGQIKDHQATIALFEKEIATGSNPELKAYAQKWLPGIKEHTKMIYQAANALGVKNAGGDGSGPPAKP